MPIYRSGGKVVLFVHIPKTGGTSIEQALVEHGAIQALKSPRGLGLPRHHKLTRISFQHLHRALLDDIVPPGFCDYVFAVVRNPLDRVLSSYLWSTRNRTHRPSFDRWFLRRSRNHLQRRYFSDNHMRPQCEFVGSDMEVFRFENGLEAPLQAACQHLNLNWNPRLLRNEKRTGVPGQPIRMYQHTLNQVRRFYAEDFDRFGYDPEEIPAGRVSVLEGRHPLSFLLS